MTIEELAILTDNQKYANFKDAKVYMVYTHNQEDNPAHVICGYPSEKEVISAFKSDKNGLMIVVDKLQTGFDEPKLHTLFIDKEIKGINAVQTVCRVNRTCKNKEDCLVVDYSIDNVNISNIKNAFDKYAGIVVSEFDSYSIKIQTEELYRKIIGTDCYIQFFAEYKKDRKNIQAAIKIQKFIENMFNNEHGKKLIIRDCEDYLNYIQKLGLIDNVIGIEDKYKEENLLFFLKDIINLIKDKLKDNSGDKVKEIVDFWFENLGMIESDLLIIEEMTTKKISDSKLKQSKDSDQPYSIIDLIKEKNKKEKEKEILIAEYLKKIHILFDKLIEFDQAKNDGRLQLKLNNLSTYNDNEISEEFNRVWGITVRRLKNDESINKFIKEIEENISLLEGDFVTYVNKKG